MTKKPLYFIAYFLLLGVFFLTHTYEFLNVPGLHFDEAWQGLFAHKIAAEPSFWPLQAMNSYTSPTIHYLLAVVFKIFGTSLLSMRSFFFGLNFLTLTLVLCLLHRCREHRTALWFLVLYSVLPLSIHNHRFYIEVTSLLPLLLVFILWGLYFWKKRPLISSVLLSASFLVGIYTHILFIAVFLATLVFAAKYFKIELLSNRGRSLLATISLLTVPLCVRMGFGLKKASPLLLAVFFLTLALIALFGTRTRKDFYSVFIKYLNQPNRRILWISSPFLIAYLFLMWNGSWPYAQATGSFDPYFFPLNLILFLVLLFYQMTTFWRKRRTKLERRIHYPVSANMVFAFFLLVFLFSSIFIFKQSPRYYMMATLLSMIWCAQRLARIRSAKTQVFLAILILGFNGWAFKDHYIQQFLKHGATTVEFRFSVFHDTSRDFRPFQKAYFWLMENHCLADFEWVEDDRFDLPLKFLRISYPDVSGNRNCPWNAKQMFFSHVSDYDEKNPDFTPPFSGIELLHHENSWGDLTFWIRKK